MSETALTQDSLPKLGVQGYIRTMPSLMLGHQEPSTDWQNLVHHRFETSFYNRNRTFFAFAALRNRWLSGSFVERQYPFLHDQLRTDPGWANLSFTPVNTKRNVWHLHIDRLYAQYFIDKWEITVGRQRINWGVNLFWNTHDLFNTFSFVDFDYAERPGSDALRLHYETGALSGVEIVYTPHSLPEKQVIAGKANMNAGGYDIQLIGGKYQKDWVGGLAWAGNLLSAGWKTEISYFHPMETSPQPDVLIASSGVDYLFNNGIYVFAGGLWKNQKVKRSLDQPLLNQFASPGPKNLIPGRSGYIAQATYSPNLKWAYTMILAYLPEVKTHLLMPSVDYTINNKWSATLFVQSFLNVAPDAYLFVGNWIFLRLQLAY